MLRVLLLVALVAAAAVVVVGVRRSRGRTSARVDPAAARAAGAGKHAADVAHISRQGGQGMQGGVGGGFGP